MHDPRVPETLEGWWLLHQMFRLRWPEWQSRPAAERREAAADAAQALGHMGRGTDGTTASCTLLGHKGDLMLIHFRRGFEQLQAALPEDRVAGPLDPDAQADAPALTPCRFHAIPRITAVIGLMITPARSA